MQWYDGLLWLACPAQSIVATYDPASGACEKRLPHPDVEHACPAAGGIWLQTRGGNLGRQLVLWSPHENRSLRRFDCPDGAASGITVVDGKLWLSHRRNRKLFCIDPESGELLWTIQTERQIFSPTTYCAQLWGVECEPGPLGDWGDVDQADYCFVRFDPVHERVVERYEVPFTPTCVAVQDNHFWYAIHSQTGLSDRARKSFSTKYRAW
jgi:outer membrane protein assembly factor BamB